MSESYTPVATAPGDITIPEDFEPADGASVRLPLTQLSDGLAYVAEHMADGGDLVAHLAAANTFTASPQTVNGPDADAPQFRTTKSAVDGGTKWMQLFEAPTDAADQIRQAAGAGGEVRTYSGATAEGETALVINARWHIGGTPHRWRQLNAAKPSYAVIIKAGVAYFSSVAAGVAYWYLWPVNTGAVAIGGTVTAGTGVTATTGNVKATAGDAIGHVNVTAETGNVVATLGNVTANGNVTATTGNVAAPAGNVAAGGGVVGGTGVVATTGNVAASAGNVVANVHVLAGNSVFAAGSVNAGPAGAVIPGTGDILLSGDLKYADPRVRGPKSISLYDAQSWNGLPVNFSHTSSLSGITHPSGSVSGELVWRVTLPDGATCGNIEIIMKNVGADITATLIKRSAGVWGAGVTLHIGDVPSHNPSDGAVIVGNSTSSTAGYACMVVACTPTVYSSQDDWFLLIDMGSDTANTIYALRWATWIDPGPRNN